METSFIFALMSDVKMSMLKKIKQFCIQVFYQFCQDGCFNRAASLAYVTLLSLVPLLTVSFSVLTAFPVFKGLARQLQDFIFSNFLTASAQAVQQHLQVFIEQTGYLNIWGMLSLLIAAVFLVFSIEQAFNAIWRVKRRRENISAFLLYWGVITFVPIVIGVGLTVISYFLSLPFVANSIMTRFGITAGLFYIAPYLMTYLAFTVLYRAVPNCKVPLRSALIAALPATILFELVKTGFAFYFVKFPIYQLIYGALAIIPIFLIWLYVSWLVILFGAVISYVYTTKMKIDLNSLHSIS